MPETVLAIFGPTASGKTVVAEAVTRRIPAEVVSADAAALFRGLEFLTAAPQYPARLVGAFDVEHDVSVGEFQRLAHTAIDDVLACGRTPVVVGGTGLYLRAALSDPEWWVRYRAAQALMSLPFLSEAELDELRHGDDRYAADMMAQVAAEKEAA